MTWEVIKNSIGLVIFAALSACAAQNPDESRANSVEQCTYPDTLTCDHFAGEDYNCSCEKGTRMSDIIDSY